MHTIGSRCLTATSFAAAKRQTCKLCANGQLTQVPGGSVGKPEKARNPFFDGPNATLGIPDSNYCQPCSNVCLISKFVRLKRDLPNLPWKFLLGELNAEKYISCFSHETCIHFGKNKFCEIFSLPYFFIFSVPGKNQNVPQSKLQQLCV